MEFFAAIVPAGAEFVMLRICTSFSGDVLFSIYCLFVGKLTGSNLRAYISECCVICFYCPNSNWFLSTMVLWGALLQVLLHCPWGVCLSHLNSNRKETRNCWYLSEFIEYISYNLWTFNLIQSCGHCQPWGSCVLVAGSFNGNCLIRDWCKTSVYTPKGWNPPPSVLWHTSYLVAVALFVRGNNKTAQDKRKIRKQKRYHWKIKRYGWKRKFENFQVIPTKRKRKKIQKSN